MLRGAIWRRVSWVFLLAPLGVSLSARANELLDLYVLAEQQDPIFQTALHQRDAALQVHPEALSALLPQISSSNSLNRVRSHVFPNTSSESYLLTGAATDETYYYNSRSWDLNLSQVLFSWPVFATLAKSNLQVAQAQATYLAAEQNLMYRVADAFFTVLNAQDTLKADLDAQAAYKLAQDQAKDKFDTGVVAITDVRNAEASYDTSSAVVISDQRALDSAKRALAQIVGLPDEPDQPVNAQMASIQHLINDESYSKVTTLQDEIPLGAPQPAVEKQWADGAASDNPVLMSYRYAADAAQKDISIAKGQWLPNLALVGSVGRSTQDYSLGQDAIQDSVGVQLSWKIFQGGLVLAQSRAAKASREVALSQYEGQRRTIYKSTRDAYEGVISGIASVHATGRAVTSTRTSLEATRVGLKVGTRTQIDVLNAQQALAVAERNYYQARYDYLRATLALKQSAGRLTADDLGHIDQWLVTRPGPIVPTPPEPTPQIHGADDARVPEPAAPLPPPPAVQPAP